MLNYLKQHDFTIIFDPDNVAPKNYLEQIDEFHKKDYLAVQSKRVPKNLDNYVACLDAAGEIYHNFVERMVPWKLGSSATIAGSGMSIKTTLYKEFLKSDDILNKIDGVILGEDKLLQNFLVLKNIKIGFQQSAILFDEKVTSNTQVQKQRTRWINAYFQNVRSAFRILFCGLEKRSFNQILFGFNTLYPPLFILTLSSMLILILNIIVGGNLYFSIILAIALISFGLNFILSLLINEAPQKVVRSIFFVPIFIGNQILSLVNLKKSKNEFLVTDKNRNVNVEELDL